MIDKKQSNFVREKRDDNRLLGRTISDHELKSHGKTSYNKYDDEKNNYKNKNNNPNNSNENDKYFKLTPKFKEYNSLLHWEINKQSDDLRTCFNEGVIE